MIAVVDDHGFQTVLERVCNVRDSKILNFCMLVLEKFGIKYTKRFYFPVAEVPQNVKLE